MSLYAWASRWNVSREAVADLQRMFGMEGTVTTHIAAPALRDEGAVMATIRLEAGRKHIPLWRNNVGALMDSEARFVRYGLANDSKAVNDRIKSADLIGIRPISIQPEHVGHVIGQFVSREVKAPGWHFTNTPREQAQLRWIELIQGNGGDACFATGEGTL